MINTITAIESTKKYLSSSDIVLDYGCGTGNITNEFADTVKEIHAIDISAGMIDVAKKLADERNIENIHYLQSTIFDESYEDGSFDVIMAFSILHLLEDIHKVIHRVNKLLKAGGLFISVLTNPTMGGVAASFASLGDLVFAEPKALIGFAGPRTIKATIRIELPKGFQTSEFLEEHGFVDRIVPRAKLKSEIARAIDYCGK